MGRDAVAFVGFPLAAAAIGLVAVSALRGLCVLTGWRGKDRLDALALALAMLCAIYGILAFALYVSE